MSRTYKILLTLVAAAAALACQPQADSSKPKTDETTKKPSVAQPAPISDSGNPLAPYIRRAIVDEFNPDVTDEERRNPPKPRRGGVLVIRMPSDLRTLNPLTRTLHPESIVMSQLQDYLIAINPETLEYIPKMAKYWRVRDYVEKRDGTRIEGLVTTQTEDAVEIVPGASLWTFLQADIVSSDTQASWIETRFGQRLRGRLTTYEYTITVAEKPSTPPLTLANDELSTWTNVIGDKEEVRLSVKRQCIYEFHLREGIQWHDGHPVTMADLKCGFDTMRNDRVDCQALKNYYIDIEKMEVLDPLTVKYTYRKPYFQALAYCGSLEFLPRHILQPERFRDDPEGYADFFNKHPLGRPGKGQFVGIGPYQLENWRSGQEVVLVRNENYWACRANLPYWKPEQPYMDKIVWRIIVEKTPALRELENGNVDADFDIEPETWFLNLTNTPAFKANFVRASYVSPAFTYIGWNEEREVFQDPQVRRALTMLIPRERILNVIHRGLGRIATGPFYVDGPCADPTVEPIPHDPEGAKRLLRSARWIDRDADGILDRDGSKFEFEYLIHTARAYHAKIANIVKQSLGQAGIKVNISRVEWTVFGETVRDHNFDAVRYAWTGLVDPDPYQIWHSTQSRGRGSNTCSYANKRVDELIERGREEFDPIKRWAMFREVYRIVHDEQPFTFMFFFDNLVFYHKRFRGVKFYPHDPSFVHYDLTEWYLPQE